MILKTKEFQAIASKILAAVGVDKQAGDLEIATRNNFLYLSITNKEFYVSAKFALDTDETLLAVVDATLFLNLISQLSSDEFELITSEQEIIIKAGKSKYKLPIIMENNRVMVLPVITPSTVNVELTIRNEILQSILNVNGKEVAKTKASNTSEMRKYFFIDEGGCFTFASNTACLNTFELDKPVKILLNDRIVKLFKLFDTDVNFKLGYEIFNDRSQPIIIFESSSIYLSARISSDDTLVARIEKNCTEARRMITQPYESSAVINVANFLSALNRLFIFAKNSLTGLEEKLLFIKLTFTPDELKIEDLSGNLEVLNLDNKAQVSAPYTMVVNLFEIKAILESAKISHITLNFGNHRTVTAVRGPVTNLFTEFV